MPTYEYACRKCGEHIEVVQSFNDDSLTTCPSCGGPLRKVFGNIGIVFKGSGFYKTDNRSSHSTSTAGTGSDKAAGTTTSVSSSESSKGTESSTSSKEAGSSKPKTEASTPRSQGSSTESKAS
ncbi:MAG: FmdB family transcriptional regulator [Actinobacteria bacterium]|nr:FmdB family transcriptional regulator [Actinomycetota bacterium]